MKHLLHLILLGLLCIGNSYAQPADLIISEYIEGSSYNKAVEIYNGTSETITLNTSDERGYFILLLLNPEAGESWQDATVIPFPESETLSQDSVFVLYHSSADEAISSRGDLATGQLRFNGNDPLALVKDNNGDGAYTPEIDELLDVLGDFSGDNFAANITLVRKSDATGNTSYTPDEWHSYGEDEFTYLGWHEANSQQDIVAPEITFTPEANAENVSLSVEPVIQFNEPIYNIYGETITDYSTLITYTNNNTPVDFQWDFNENDLQLTISTNAPLAPETTYQITLSAIEDQAGNETTDTTITFTTTKASTSQAPLLLTQYIEGSSNNKAIEIGNPTNQEVDLSQYEIRMATNGGDWRYTCLLTGTIAPWKVYVIGNQDADQTILNEADTTHSVANYNGDDVVALFFNNELIDAVGNYGEDPGYAWDVAGINEATRNHTLFRKAEIQYGTTNWTEAAGTNAEDSQWEVTEQDNYENLGTLPLGLFTEAQILAFSLPGQSSPTEIDQNNYTISLSIPDTINVSYLVPEVEISPGAITNPDITTPQNFTQPVVYSITSGDGNTHIDWTIQVELINIINADLYISQYIEGSTPNTALEIGNATDKEIDLSEYEVRMATNGGEWRYMCQLSGALPPWEVYVITNENAATEILALADTTHQVAEFNGDDVIALYYQGIMVDAIGIYGQDPGYAWDVAGVTEATRNHTLLRKAEYTQGTIQWAASAGTNPDDSQWQVEGQDNLDNLGALPLGLFPDADILSFSLPGQTSATIINTDEHTVSLSIPDTVNISSIIPEMEISPGAIANPEITTPQNYTQPVVYSITSGDGNTHIDWTVQVELINIINADLYISQYIEGSTPNTALEIGNATNKEIDLSEYEVRMATNGGEWRHLCQLSGTLPPWEVYVITNENAATEIQSLSDTTHQVAEFNGDDVVALYYQGIMIDIIGVYGEDPGYAWDVAGVNEATRNHTLLRKAEYTQGTIQWAASAGTNPDDSQWQVKAQDNLDNLGTLPLELFTEAQIVSFEVPGQIDETQIDSKNYLITFTITDTVNITSIIPHIEISPGATIEPSEDTPQNLSQPIIYGVTSGDGNTYIEWTIMATIIKIPTPDIYFSEYIEGDRFNKAIEVYNPTDQPIALSDYRICLKPYELANPPYIYYFEESSLDPGQTLVLIHPYFQHYHLPRGARFTTVSSPGILDFDGNDALVIEKRKTSQDSWTSVDVIGQNANNPGTGWEVAGTENATTNHTLLRKAIITFPESDWTASAGQNPASSQWIVLRNNNANNLGTPTPELLNEAEIISIEAPGYTTWNRINFMAHHAIIFVNGATDLSAIPLELQLSPGATSKPESGSWFDLSHGPVEVIVIAEDGTQQTWRVFGIGSNIFPITRNKKVTESTTDASNLLKQQFSDQQILCFPNPANDYLHLWQVMETSPVKAQLYNAAGVLVKEELFNTQLKTLNISDLPSGMYILIVKTKDTTKTYKLMKE